MKDNLWQMRCWCCGNIDERSSRQYLQAMDDSGVIKFNCGHRCAPYEIPRTRPPLSVAYQVIPTRRPMRMSG